MDALGAGEFAQVAERFDDRLRERLTVTSLEQTWDQVLLGAGPYLRTSSARVERRSDSEVVFLRTHFARTAMETLIAFDPEGEIVGLAIRPVPPRESYDAPPYVDRSRFAERDVRVPDPEHFCGTGTCGLPGTLSVPRGTGPFPAVVLVHGSGPQDRDQTLNESKPFRDLAWGLGTLGIAVLRYEKRTYFLRGRLGAKAVENLTVKQEYIDDALGAIGLLRGVPEVDGSRLFLLGHSQGGAVLPRLARADARLAGFIAMAGPLRPLEDIVLDQLQFIAAADGEVDATEAKELARLADQVARVKTLDTAAAVPAADLPLGIPRAYWLDLARNPPQAALAGEQRPFLVLQGERDYQVTLADFRLWQSVLRASPRARFKTYPALNHLFIAGQGPITSAEYSRPGYVDVDVIKDIAAFVHQTAGPAL